MITYMTGMEGPTLSAAVAMAVVTFLMNHTRLAGKVENGGQLNVARHYLKDRDE